jgi:3-oxoacyl-[acyl-carrier protein] reductase
MATIDLTKDPEPKVVPKIALITGATGGIGRATAIALGKEGYALALHYNTASQEKVKELTDDIENCCPRYRTFKADLSDFNAVRTLHAHVVSLLGNPTVLFLNAGSTGGKYGVKSLAEISMEAFETTWRINTASPFLLTKLCLPAMEADGYGRIIFNSSVAGLTGGIVGPHYASSKSAIHGLVHWLAGHLASKGITVNAVAPALIEKTAMLPAGKKETLAASKYLLQSMV